jgi:hypothetical protein
MSDYDNHITGLHNPNSPMNEREPNFKFSELRTAIEGGSTTKELLWHYEQEFDELKRLRKFEDDALKDMAIIKGIFNAYTLSGKIPLCEKVQIHEITDKYV